MSKIIATHRKFIQEGGVTKAVIVTNHFTRQDMKDEYAALLRQGMDDFPSIVYDIYVGEDVVIGTFAWGEG